MKLVIVVNIDFGNSGENCDSDYSCKSADSGEFGDSFEYYIMAILVDAGKSANSCESCDYGDFGETVASGDFVYFGQSGDSGDSFETSE